MANNEPQSKDLGDGYTITVALLPGRRGLKVFNRLIKVLGGAGDSMKGLLKTVAKPGAGGELESRVTEGLLGAISSINEDDVDFLAQELLAPAIMQTPEGKQLPLGNAGHFDVVFTGRVDLVYKALAFAVVVNYGGFLKGWVASLLAKVQATVAAAPAPIAPASK